jgi:hypothetical protein
LYIEHLIRRGGCAFLYAGELRLQGMFNAKQTMNNEKQTNGIDTKTQTLNEKLFSWCPGVLVAILL